MISMQLLNWKLNRKHDLIRTFFSDTLPVSCLKQLQASKANERGKKDIRGEHHLYQQHGTQILPDSLGFASTFAGAYYPGGGLIIFSHQKLQEMAGDGSALDSPVVSARVTLPSPLLRRSPLASLFLEISPDAPIAPSLSSSGPPDLFKRPALRHLWRLTPQRRARD
ncbi:hypothetical protein ROHU_020591 [Labeo rohita]|uniref:Uncharacterized protein n=1 Tax=Labeo rohita TaxID=84645 RepID=A0A498MXE3_LABRO|nr:hypothetical protein ROHU_021290 [Labeo rohita]RXN26689.1 hypothetical protein ROHU_020591 [Labeo rohita]